MSAEAEVRSASKAFYAALNRMANGDAGAMAAAWSQEPSVTAMHPIGGRLEGWDAVRTSFDQVARLAGGGAIELREQRITVLGEAAIELGVEHGRMTLGGMEAALEFRVTNVYRRTADGWKLVHHHTDPSQPMLDILARLPAQ